MRDLYLIRCLCVFSVWLFSLGVAFGQQIDTTAYHELSGVEVVEKVRPSVTREGTPLQIMDRAGIDRLGVQDLSEAVKLGSYSTGLWGDRRIENGLGT